MSNWKTPKERVDEYLCETQGDEWSAKVWERVITEAQMEAVEEAARFLWDSGYGEAGRFLYTERCSDRSPLEGSE